MNLVMVEPARFYFRNVIYRSLGYRNCRMLFWACWAFWVIALERRFRALNGVFLKNELCFLKYSFQVMCLRTKNMNWYLSDISWKFQTNQKLTQRIIPLNFWFFSLKSEILDRNFKIDQNILTKLIHYKNKKYR